MQEHDMMIARKTAIIEARKKKETAARKNPLIVSIIPSIGRLRGGGADSA